MRRFTRKNEQGEVECVYNEHDDDKYIFNEDGSIKSGLTEITYAEHRAIGEAEQTKQDESMSRKSAIESKRQEILEQILERQSGGKYAELKALKNDSKKTANDIEAFDSTIKD